MAKGLYKGILDLTPPTKSKDLTPDQQEYLKTHAREIEINGITQKTALAFHSMGRNPDGEPIETKENR